MPRSFLERSLNYYEHSHIIRSKASLLSYMALDSDTQIEFYNGLMLRFGRGERRLLAKISKGLLLLRQIGITPAVRGRMLAIGLPDGTEIAAEAGKLTKREIGNLFLLLFYAIKYGAIVGNERLKFIEGLSIPFVRFDMKRKIVETDAGIRIHLDLLSPWVFTETYVLRMHDKLQGNARGRTFLDIGGAFGDTALYFAQKGYEVYTLEPSTVNFEAMRENLKLNPELAKRIHPMQAALGRDGTLKLSYIEGIIDGIAGGVYRRGTNSEEVKSYSLGSLLKELGLARVDFLKMDCKGCEDFLKVEELKKVNSYFKIEYDTDDDGKLDLLLKKIERAGFGTRVVYRHNPEDVNPVLRHGTIFAIRG